MFGFDWDNDGDDDIFDDVITMDLLEDDKKADDSVSGEDENDPEHESEQGILTPMSRKK